ncbi:C40 family peptidase [Phaeacidiphilus oryzae]|uniref:C40 family peptidase n=1 Tax=Phaeacidiphilus oryzae TaxID=348818 RepID=UPI000A02933A|nr:bifunctional lytic transglycosylase/C40 family peptidase [Phaeacidiphilus oryzae]
MATATSPSPYPSAEARAAGAAATGCGAFLLLAAATAAAVLTTAAALATGGLSSLLSGPAPSPSALADIPPRMLTLYQQAAATCPGLPWTVMAGIGKVESDHDRAHDQTSTAGAVGPMQFLPATFAVYDHPVPPGGATPPTPWDPTDATYAAAHLLCASGARNGHDIPHAIYAYNHSWPYVRTVLGYARTYATAAPAAGTGGPTRAAADAVAYARSQLGVPYQWGAEAPGHAFDCSGLVQAAYAFAGIHLPRVAQAQYDHGRRLPPNTPYLPGDLVFFGPDPTHIEHVGIAIGNGAMIDAPHTGAVVRQEQIGTPVAASRPTG